MNTSNRFGRTRLIGLLAGALLLGAAQAQAANDCNGNANVASISQAAVTSATEGSTVSIALHPNAKGSLFTWTYVSGPVVTPSPATGAQTTFTLPMIPGTQPAVLTIRLTASGCNRPAASTDFQLNVTQLVNIEPVAVASASSASVNEGAAVNLIGTSSYDPDNDPILYAWTQTAGPAVTISNANTATASFTAPSVAATTTLTFQLKVTENTPAAKFSLANVSVNVLNVNVPPVASLSCPSQVNEGALLTLNGSGSYDPDSLVLSYNFSQLTGLPLAALPLPPYGNSVSFNAPALGFGQTGLVKFGLTVTDGDNASASADCSLFIKDVTAPVLSGASDITEEATSSAGAMATFSVSAYDNVDGASVATCSPASGSTFAIGTTTVNCSQNDSAGNVGSASFTVTVQDTTAPVIAFHGDESAEATSAAGAFVSYASPATSDAVDGAGTAICAPASGSQFALGSTTVYCNASDAHGNAATQTSFQVLVADTTAPDITAPANVTAEATGVLTTVAYDSATATDAVGPVTISSDAPAQFPLGETTIHWTATDGAMNSSSTTSTVTVVDTTPPTVDDNADQTLEATSAAGAAATFPTPTAHDLVDGDFASICDYASGATFPIGTTTVTCSATDAHNNTGSSSFDITVQDTTPPVIAAHGDESAEATSAAGAIVSYTSPATSDIVDGAGVATCAPASGSQFALGSTTVYCNATDAHGNPAVQTSFQVSVVDTTPPVIAAHGNVSAEATSAAGAIVSYISPATSDIVDGAGVATCAPASGSQFALGSTTVYCNATDAHGNPAVQTSFQVSVVDTTAPVISFHADVTAFATSASGAVVNYTLPTASDIVDGNVPVSCSPASGSTFAIGTTDVTCTATDSHGNSATSHFNVIVSYNFTGFFKPVDNLPIVNVVKAGQGIPVKFSLGGNMGLNIFATGYPRSVAMTCSTNTLQDAVEETVNAGGSSLSYDATVGQYIYVWKTDKAWAGTCRQLQVKYTDGSIKVANFNFTR